MYRKQKKENRAAYAFLKKITNAINSVRYGNLSDRIKQEKIPQLNGFIESINRMIETIEDRENMIKEYQKWLCEKNISLENLVEKEKEAQKLKEDFVATLGHDLKVPIIAEGNMLDFLLEGRFGDLSEKVKDVILKLKNSNAELISLVEVLLETYKFEENIAGLKRENVNLTSLIADIIDEMTIIATVNCQSIEFYSDSQIEADADKLQISRVLRNIISNALSFSYKNSSIKIELFKSGSKVIIKVIDSGLGISAEDIDNIFDKYYSTAKKFRKVGTGLGLYLSNQIVLAHGGKITVESVPNQITTFTIELPIGL